MVRRNINVASRPPFKGNEERLEPSGFEPFDVGAITDERPPTAVEGVVMFKPTSGRGKLGGPRNPHQKVSQIQRFEPKGDGRLSSVSRRWNSSPPNGLAKGMVVAFMPDTASIDHAANSNLSTSEFVVASR
jgi:hypothetical protein